MPGTDQIISGQHRSAPQMRSDGLRMTFERDIRPTSPVHVHVHENGALHVHMKKPKRPLQATESCTSVTRSVAPAHGSGNLRRPASSGAVPTVVPTAAPWVPPPGKSSKNAHYTWQGASHRLDIGAEETEQPLQLCQLSADNDETNRSKQNERKIDGLMHDVDVLRTMVSTSTVGGSVTALRMSERTVCEQERELESYRRELDETEGENLRLRHEGPNLSRNERQRLSNEREQMLKKLVEVEMDGQTAVRLMAAFRDTVRLMKKGEPLAPAAVAQLQKQRQQLVQQLGAYEETNRALRALLRDRHDEEASCARLADQRDMLLGRLAATDGDGERLRCDIRGLQQLNEDLRQNLKAQQEETLVVSNQQASLETTRAHLQKQLRQKEADCNRMAVQVRSLESQLAQEKIDVDRLRDMLSTTRDKSERDKQALKTATRAQKHRAVRSESSVKQMGSGLLERDAKLAEARAELESLAEHYDRVSKEKSQAIAENAASNTRVDELESIVERLEEECQRSTAESAAKLQECTVQLATSRLDGERLQTTIGDIEQKSKDDDSDRSDLRTRLSQYEVLVEEYRAQTNKSRQEADESFVQLEDKQKEIEKIHQDSEAQLDTVKSRLQSRLRELEPIPELLKSTELQLQDSVGQLRRAEHSNAQQSQLVSQLSGKLERQNEQLSMMRGKYTTSEDGSRSITLKLESLESKIHDMEDRNRDLLCSIAKKEECFHQNSRELDEKSRENASLMRQLDASLTDAKRQTDAAHDKSSSKDRMMQSRALQMETQLSQTKAEVTRIRREKDETERKANRCVGDLRDRLEQAESNGRALQNYVQLVKSTYSRLFGDIDFPAASPVFT